MALQEDSRGARGNNIAIMEIIFLIHPPDVFNLWITAVIGGNILGGEYMMVGLAGFLSFFPTSVNEIRAVRRLLLVLYSCLARVGLAEHLIMDPSNPLVPPQESAGRVSAWVLQKSGPARYLFIWEYMGRGLFRAIKKTFFSSWHLFSLVFLLGLILVTPQLPSLIPPQVEIMILVLVIIFLLSELVFMALGPLFKGHPGIFVREIPISGYRFIFEHYDYIKLLCLRIYLERYQLLRVEDLWDLEANLKAIHTQETMDGGELDFMAKPGLPATSLRFKVDGIQSMLSQSLAQKKSAQELISLQKGATLPSHKTAQHRVL